MTVDEARQYRSRTKLRDLNLGMRSDEIISQADRRDLVTVDHHSAALNRVARDRQDVIGGKYPHRRVCSLRYRVSISVTYERVDAMSIRDVKSASLTVAALTPRVQSSTRL